MKAAEKVDKDDKRGQAAAITGKKEWENRALGSRGKLEENTGRPRTCI